jgi:hypothetical protein
MDTRVGPTDCAGSVWGRTQVALGRPDISETRSVVVRYTIVYVELLDLDLLADEPFEVDAQAAHLFKHPHLGLEDVYDVWVSDRDEF